MYLCSSLTNNSRMAKKNTKFEVQSELYQALKDRGINARARVKMKNCFPDLSIYNRGGGLECLVIIKAVTERYMENRYSPERMMSQGRYRKYMQFNVPVLVCVYATDSGHPALLGGMESDRRWSEGCAGSPGAVTARVQVHLWPF